MNDKHGIFDLHRYIYIPYQRKGEHRPVYLLRFNSTIRCRNKSKLVDISIERETKTKLTYAKFTCPACQKNVVFRLMSMKKAISIIIPELTTAIEDWREK